MCAFRTRASIWGPRGSASENEARNT
jgi:hypothetical protein